VSPSLQTGLTKEAYTAYGIGIGTLELCNAHTLLCIGTLRVLPLCTVGLKGDSGKCACRFAGEVLDKRCSEPGRIPDCNAISQVGVELWLAGLSNKVSVRCTSAQEIMMPHTYSDVPETQRATKMCVVQNSSHVIGVMTVSLNVSLVFIHNLQGCKGNSQFDSRVNMLSPCQ